MTMFPPSYMNRAARRAAEKQKLMRLSEHKRKSRVLKHMDRPGKTDRVNRGHQLIEALVQRGVARC